MPSSTRTVHPMTTWYSLKFGIWRTWSWCRPGARRAPSCGAPCSPRSPSPPSRYAPPPASAASTHVQLYIRHTESLLTKGSNHVPLAQDPHAISNICICVLRDRLFPSISFLTKNKSLKVFGSCSPWINIFPLTESWLSSKPTGKIMVFLCALLEQSFFEILSHF